jgi:hypothetical protein
MALETFDRGGSLDHTARVTDAQKEKARWLVAVAMSERGESSDDIIDVFDMLGLWPDDHVRSGYGAI